MQWYLGYFQTNSLTDSPMFSLLDMFLYTAVQMCWIAIAFWWLRRTCSRCMEDKLKWQWYKQPLYKSTRYLGGIALCLMAVFGSCVLFSSMRDFIKTKLDFAFISSTMPKYCFDYFLLFVSVGLILVSIYSIVKNVKRLCQLYKEFVIRCNTNKIEESE